MHNEIIGDILSCVVYTQPGCGAEVAALIGAQPGAEVLAGVAERKQHSHSKPILRAIKVSRRRQRQS
ncbi:hypothetical protein [Halochromatium roseum]|uniref:hypothetical protein n=1 Tax=Halochromatium roseum TaxID=391920 RepID=UPI001912A7B0|nr:hypothetical protein [Halochromatium roseum]MBK5940971.1 hypothetical protein [Halochromatium roseum]